MLAVEEALDLVAKNAGPLASRRVPLSDAAGLVLAEDVVSEVNSPPYSKSMMDGYAVRSLDHEPRRQILGEVAAGDVPRIPLTPGTAIRIMTGAPLPEGADAVVPIEQTELIDAATVQFHQTDPPRGQNVLPVGAALRAGDTVLHEGAMLRPIEIAILAEIGRSLVTVRPRPRVAILTTGNELVPVGEKAGRGQIYNSNGPMLVAAAQQAGAEATELGIARDDRERLRQWIEQGLAADVLVLSGGVSAGAFDFVPSVLAELNVQQVFHKISLRPGKPLWFGIKDDAGRRVLVFGLPGNPVSSFVCFELFVRPAIAALAGLGFIGRPTIEAALSHSFDHRGERAACLPARISFPSGTTMSKAARGDASVEILRWQGSADLAALARANGLARFPNRELHLAAGDRIDVVVV